MLASRSEILNSPIDIRGSHGSYDSVICPYLGMSAVMPDTIKHVEEFQDSLRLQSM